MKGFKKSVFSAIVFFTLSPFLLSAQSTSDKKDSLSSHIELGAVYSDLGFLPLYLVSNRWGALNEDQSVFISGGMDYTARISEKLRFTSGFSLRNEILNSHYLELGYDKFSLSIGRFKDHTGGIENSLSSGSMIVSNNARPIPQIKLGLLDYVSVPWTNGYFKTKGHIAQGWLESDRFMSNALLHSKSFYLQLDLEKEIGWSAASGLVHFAQYGGVSPQGDQQASSFSDFLRVFSGSGVPNPDGTTAGESNGLGNHLGVVETTIIGSIGNSRLTINYQKPFEDFGGLQYISFTDYLLGVEWDFPESIKFVNKIYIEYIQTKWQSGPGLPDATDAIQTQEDNFGYKFGGRDDTYNNFLYRSGWTYQGQVIGNPLFLTYRRTLNFLDPYQNYGVSIANNRLSAIHFGLNGYLGKKLSYKTQFTFTRNFGTYAGLHEGRFNWQGVTTDPDFQYAFRPVQEQMYSLIDLEYFFDNLKTPMKINVKMAYDFGDLYSNFGSELSVTYVLN